MLTMRLVISIDLSPTGGMLATGSGDWGARLCEFLRFDFPMCWILMFGCVCRELYDVTMMKCCE